MQTWVLRLGAAALIGLLGAPAAFSQQDADAPLTPEEEQALAAMREFWESLDRQTGQIVLGDELITLEVPDNFYFLDAQDAERVLVEAWGNPPGQETLGMLLPAEYTPFDRESWAVTIHYSDDGHVSDSDAAEIDYNELLAEMQSDIRSANPDRIDEGYEPIELIGWAEQPRYDAASRKLYWAKELRFGEASETTLNYEIRALGRTGVLSMTFIAGTDQLGEINASRESVLAMAEFNPGSRYEDFDSNVDKVAAYGIGALVAGKVAAKAGLFAAALVLLKKFGVFLVLGLAALARQAKRLLFKPAV
jgi:uncharacterized membrane-anchored protein